VSAPDVEPTATLAGWFDALLAALDANRALVVGLAIASVAMFVGGIVVVNLLIVRMPADWFVRVRRAPRRHPVAHVVLLVLRNLLGVAMLLLGVAMLVGPGQGILMILLALGLLEFPGKRRIELAIVRRRPIRRAIDWMRHRAGKPPLQIPVPGRHRDAVTSDAPSRTDGTRPRTRSNSDPGS
jgi:hypothetical protein